MTQIKIEKPKTRWQSWAKRIALRLLFPPVLLWDLAKLAANKLLGKFVASLVLPAINDGFNTEFPHENTQQMLKQINDNDIESLSAEALEIETYDNAKLDTVEISHKESDEYIINLVGNGMCYEHVLPEMRQTAIDLKRNVIGFNFRGVGHSTGMPTSSDDLVTDGIAQVQRLLDKGVAAEKIYLKGHSLGAGVATLVAKHFLDHGILINLFNGRSFSSITNFVVGQIRTLSPEHTGHSETFGKKLLGWIAKPIIKFAVSLVKWEMEAGDAFSLLPTPYKEYVVVRTPKEYRTKDVLDDPVIPHYASIHAAIKDERKDQKNIIDQQISGLNTTAHLMSPLAIPALTEAKKQLQTARETFKQRKMSCDPNENGHVVLLSELKNRSNINANTFFNEFVERAHNHHEQVKIKKSK